MPGTSTVTYGSPKGQTTATVEEMNRREVVLGPRSGSCGQWDIWEAVFGPRGADGYPARVWCKDPTKGCEYGAINTTVAITGATTSTSWACSPRVAGGA